MTASSTQTIVSPEAFALKRLSWSKAEKWNFLEFSQISWASLLSSTCPTHCSASTIEQIQVNLDFILESDILKVFTHFFGIIKKWDNFPV